MELIDQKTKAIMEGCKDRARKAGLKFQDETLEYIVTNRDLIELTPKFMIPTMYDYWVHDVEVLREKGRYELYPSNPYETVINTRPAISFYNDNNPDWMNVMIFYHVLAHIDFFQNNIYFRNTWDYDFTGQALSDKRMLVKLRSEKGRWVDYIIEFARGIDNLVGYYSDLIQYESLPHQKESASLNFYFDVFLQTIRKVPVTEYMKELERFNKYTLEFGERAEQIFFTEIRQKHPEFNSLLGKYGYGNGKAGTDLLQYIMKNSDFLRREQNAWMRSVIEIVRKTSLFFQPQIRTKIMNEGWASYWHEHLFLADDRIKGHEVDFAKTHSGVAALPRIGLNPYALGMRLFQYIEDLANKGKYTIEFTKTRDILQRKDWNKGTNNGRDYIFEVRKNLCDNLFIDYYTDQEFIDKHDLFVAGKRLNQERMVWEYYIKSRKASEYKEMLKEHLYHPPYIEVNSEKTKDGILYLNHNFEGKPLVSEYIANTMLGIEYLWGGPVVLETSEIISDQSGGRRYGGSVPEKPDDKKEYHRKRVLYTMKERKLSKQDL
ncbi:MAG: SpoVR family protein [Fibrobacter sp.]|nr:SpoVR family protein [Fibrobacter sp.]